MYTFLQVAVVAVLVPNADAESLTEEAAFLRRKRGILTAARSVTIGGYLAKSR